MCGLAYKIKGAWWGFCRGGVLTLKSQKVKYLVLINSFDGIYELKKVWRGFKKLDKG